MYAAGIGFALSFLIVPIMLVVEDRQDKLQRAALASHKADLLRRIANVIGRGARIEDEDGLYVVWKQRGLTGHCTVQLTDECDRLPDGSWRVRQGCPGSLWISVELSRPLSFAAHRGDDERLVLRDEPRDRVDDLRRWCARAQDLPIDGIEGTSWEDEIDDFPSEVVGDEAAYLDAQKRSALEFEDESVYGEYGGGVLVMTIDMPEDEIVRSVTKIMEYTLGLASMIESR